MFIKIYNLKHRPMTAQQVVRLSNLVYDEFFYICGSLITSQRSWIHMMVWSRDLANPSCPAHALAGEHTGAEPVSVLWETTGSYERGSGVTTSKRGEEPPLLAAQGFSGDAASISYIRTGEYISL